eukprot:g3574.t1
MQCQSFRQAPTSLSASACREQIYGNVATRCNLLRISMHVHHGHHHDHDHGHAHSHPHEEPEKIQVASESTVNVNGKSIKLGISHSRPDFVNDSFESCGCC